VDWANNLFELFVADENDQMALRISVRSGKTLEASNHRVRWRWGDPGARPFLRRADHGQMAIDRRILHYFGCPGENR
jgi:hypothetical protein